MLLLQVPYDQYEERRTFPMQLSLLNMDERSISKFVYILREKKFIAKHDYTYSQQMAYYTYSQQMAYMGIIAIYCL